MLLPFSHIKRQSKEERPRYYIQWHLTDACNLHCDHCYQDENRRTMSYDKALELLGKLEAFFAAMEEPVQPQINLTGGEPFLYRELLPLIDEIRKRGWLWGLLTNGTLLNQQMAQELQLRKPVFVQVSLEGPQEFNDRCRGVGTFEQILKAVDMLNEAGIKTLVSFTVTSKNYRAFSETAAICRAHKVHKLWCDRFVGQGELCVSTEQYQEFLEILQEEREKPEGAMNIFTGREKNNAAKKNSATIISAERSLQFLAGGNGYICGAGRSLLVFLPDGTVLPCRRLEIPLGNIFQVDSLAELLDQSAVWKALSVPRLSMTCVSCPDLRRCQGGAKCVTYAQTGSFWGTDVNCPRR